MLKKNKIILFAILFIDIVFIIYIVSKVVTKMNNDKIQETDDENIASVNDDFNIDIKPLNLCQENVDCPSVSYSMISFDIDSKVLETLSEKINAQMEDDIQETLKTNTEASECSEVSSMYKYRLINNDFLNVYSGDKYITISFERNFGDICQDDNYQKDIEIYYYDKTNDRLLTMEEFMMNIGVSREDVIKVIRDNIDLDDIDDDNIDFKFYLNFNGDASAYYEYNAEYYYLFLGFNLDD